MSAPFTFHQQFSKPRNHAEIDRHFNFSNPWRMREKENSVQVRARVRCGSKNYYELLGVSSDASAKEIKEAYRKLQKIYHPDIAGQKGHESTLMLNKAYKVLMGDDLRKEYDASIGSRIGAGVCKGSIWKGPLRAQALFVDENACIGCRECVHYAGNTFEMDEAHGTARVKVQYGDDDRKIEVTLKISVDSCPVNCIHWVETEDLSILEYLIQPQPKPGYGIYGQGWERPANVFMAAKSFNKQLNQQPENQQKSGFAAERTDEEETPAQAEARERAQREQNTGSFSRIWSWIKENNHL